MKVHVVGSGLIGTSVGLALAGAADVLLSDPSQEHLAGALARGAGRRWDGQEVCDLALVCAPPRAVAAVVVTLARQDLAGTISHVSSHQSRVQAEVEALLPGPQHARVCGGHPLAGRERSGPAAASARLFVDRPWVVCPSARTTAAALRSVEDLAVACGAVPVRADPQEHDAAVALVSHLPQLAASAVAAQLLGTADGGFDPLRLAGPGVQDVTRVAASDPELWVDVLSRNARHVAPLVRALADDLHRVADALAGRGTGGEADLDPVRELLERGRAGRHRLPLKQRHGAATALVVVSVTDEPGHLAGVLQAAAEVGVNVEDLRVEHLAGRPRGLVELLVPVHDAARARAGLTAAGWDVLDGV